MKIYNEIANLILFVGIVMLLGSVLAVLRWHYARGQLHPGPEQAKNGKEPPKPLTREERVKYEATEIEACDTLLAFAWIAGVLFVLAAVLRFWPW